MTRHPTHGPEIETERIWWQDWVDPNTQQPFIDKSDRIVPLKSNKKVSQMSTAEKAAANKYDRLSERRKWLWAQYRGAEQTKRTRTHTED